MKTLSVLSTLTILVFSLFAITEVSAINVQSQDSTSPTPNPTYDPLAEPILPENPSELDLGRFWFWHNCMTCHGDVGQGLTDEFRGIWPEDHQNCWAHGCHSGNSDGGGFPIPRYVPPLVSSGKLSKFSQESLYEYLKSTHPPQTPGILEDEQYQAIIKFLFEMNERPLEESTPVPTSTPSPTASPTTIPEEPSDSNMPEPTSPSAFPSGMLSIGVILMIILIWRLRTIRSIE
jgi:hypothetical protein